MAHGDVQQVSATGLPHGAVITASGRVSAARQFGDVPTTPPLTRVELVALDEALIRATRDAGVRFSIFIGDLGSDAYAGAESVFPAIPEPEHGVLIAVSPNSKDIVVLSGAAAKVSDKVAQLGVTAAIPPFQAGDLTDGLIAALRVMTAALIAP